MTGASWGSHRSRSSPALALFAVTVLAGCSEPARRADQQEAVESGWRLLDDGSVGRLRTIAAGDRRADRCWIGEQHDCVFLSERRLGDQRILIAGRTLADEPPSGRGPVFGYTCAIYPNGAIEQRIIRPDDGLLTRSSLNEERWTPGEVRQLLAESGLSHSEVVSCTALQQLVGGDEVDRLFSISLRRAIAPPSDAI